MVLELPEGSDLLPPGKHEATVDEVEAGFVTAFPSSVTRRPLFEQWISVREAISRLVAVEIEWIDGSYVTRKEDPNDIDLVSHLNGSELEQLDDPARTTLLGLVAGPVSQYLHACDSYLVAYYPDGHPARPVYRTAANYWEGVFSSTRNGNPKGFVEIRDG